jgi:ribosomal protein L37AE/L43A
MYQKCLQVEVKMKTCNLCEKDLGHDMEGIWYGIWYCPECLAKIMEATTLLKKIGCSIFMLKENVERRSGA